LILSFPLGVPGDADDMNLVMGVKGKGKKRKHVVQGQIMDTKFRGDDFTIKGNLFWAFAYNIVAIPIAALGFLSPTFGALIMGMSDVVLAINSIRLSWKKVI
jgi:hypothetical protein